MSQHIIGSTRPGSPRRHRIVAGLVLALVVLSACSADPTGAGSIDRGGRLPPGLSGKIAYSTLVTASGPSGSTVQGLVHVVDIATGIPRTVYEPRGKMIEGLSWAPDGLHLAVQTFEFRPVGPNGQNNSIREIHLIDLQGSEDRVVFDDPGPEIRPAYSRDGRLAYHARWSTDPTSGIFVDGRSVLPLGLMTSNNYLTWSPDGRVIVFSQQDVGLSRLDPETGSISPLLAPDGDVIVQPAWSPDGSRTAMQRYGGVHGDGEIWTVAADGSDARALTSGGADDSPTYSPDGRYIAFGRLRGTGAGINIVPSGGGTPIRLLTVPGWPSNVTWGR